MESQIEKDLLKLGSDNRIEEMIIRFVITVKEKLRDR